MIFTLEALQALHGDSLILHYGDEDAPRFIVIDGGPEAGYRKFLRERLRELPAGSHFARSSLDIIPISVLNA